MINPVSSCNTAVHHGAGGWAVLVAAVPWSCGLVYFFIMQGTVVLNAYVITYPRVITGGLTMG